MKVRLAQPNDVPVIVELIRELAIYEHMEHEVVVREEQLTAALFASSPSVFCHAAELDDAVVGFALWFLNFSTWLGTSGLYLEDLYVKEQCRGLGIGSALMKQLAKVCLDRAYSRFQWWVLDWNEPSIKFYESIGAEPMSEWTVFRLSGDALVRYATA